MTVLSALASGSPATSSSLADVAPGILGFLVVAALAVALVFLLRSMNKQFRKLGPKPEGPQDELDAPDPQDAEPADARHG